MFPQSELDNYKLQVELLQEKLQRSEISRQHLEHKLDKILQKRDEHDKVVRSKARQKYQLFLEEQQRRNERNKQLVQMLERIEQQTEVMNARSERLKMMKLQYEVYFAKLVHSQTRRCIQNSVQPITPIMASTQPIWPTVQQPTKEDYNYVTNKETTSSLVTNNSYQEYATMAEENVTVKTSDFPTLTNLNRKDESNNYIDPSNIEMAPSLPPQQLYQFHARKDVAHNMMSIPENLAFYHKQQEMLDRKTLLNKTNGNMSNSSAASFISNDKKLAEPQEYSNSSTTTTSSTFEEIPNLAMMSQKLPPKGTTSSLNDATIGNTTSNCNKSIVQPLNDSQSVNEMLSTSFRETNNAARENINKFNTNAQDQRNEIQMPKTNDKTMPNEYETTSTSFQIENTNVVTEVSSSSIKNKNFLKKQPISIEQIEPETSFNETEQNSSTTPVSIENIENVIYGERLTPLETAEVEQQQATSNVVPKLLENLVTQSETNENPSFEETEIEQEEISVAQNESNDTAATANNNEQNQLSYNYDHTITTDNFNNIPQSEESAKDFADYANYESTEGAAIIDESQQQYDYSNYDPAQYSYPGYIYDETTGEYKPDPNAPAEQYATDQQYAAEGYEQQQYQQQDYDYNQTYAEEPAGLSVDNTVNNDYDNAEQQETATNLTPIGTNATAAQQQIETQPEPIPSETNETLEEVSTPATLKVAKPTSILSSADKSDSQKKKKRVNFIDSSETDESAIAPDKGAVASATSKLANGNSAGSSESDFDFSSSTEASAKTT